MSSPGLGLTWRDLGIWSWANYKDNWGDNVACRKRVALIGV